MTPKLFNVLISQRIFWRLFGALCDSAQSRCPHRSFSDSHKSLENTLKISIN